MRPANRKTSDHPRPRADLTGWMLRAGVMIFFLAFGADKFASGPGNSWVGIFARIGLGQWFRIVTGVIEVGGAVLYLFPATCKVAAVILGLTMIGAIVAHVTVLGDPGASAMPAVVLVATVLIAVRPEAEAVWTARRVHPR